MVLISAAVCDKKGKVIFARQFTEISRLKIEEYLVFPNL